MRACVHIAKSHACIFISRQFLCAHVSIQANLVRAYFCPERSCARMPRPCASCARMCLALCAHKLFRSILITTNLRRARAHTLPSARTPARHGDFNAPMFPARPFYMCARVAFICAHACSLIVWHACMALSGARMDFLQRAWEAFTAAFVLLTFE
jgi:hypothetical protein